MSSSAISSAVFTPINKKKKLREIFANTTTNGCDDKQSLCKVPRRKDRLVPNSMPPLKIDTAQCDDSVLKAVPQNSIFNQFLDFAASLIIILSSTGLPH
jgi:hypothetical protein